MNQRRFRVDLCNRETGEIVNTRYYNSYNTVKKSYRFIKFNKHPEKMFDKMSYCGYFYILSLYLERYTNRLVSYNKRGVPTAFNKNSMAKLLGISRPTLNLFLEEADGLNIIKYDDYDNAYFVNPNYALNGRGIAEPIDDMFNGDSYDKE